MLLSIQAVWMGDRLRCDSSGARGVEEVLSGMPIAEDVASHLAPYLGPFNAKMAVRTYAVRTLEVKPEALTAEHVPALLAALQPMLHTFVGRATTETVLQKIRDAVR